MGYLILCISDNTQSHQNDKQSTYSSRRNCFEFFRKLGFFVKPPEYQSRDGQIRQKEYTNNQTDNHHQFFISLQFFNDFHVHLQFTLPIVYRLLPSRAQLNIKNIASYKYVKRVIKTRTVK